MPDYHEYHVDIEDDQGNQRTEVLHVHEDHHNAFGFDGNNALKNTTMLVTIAAGAMGIAEGFIKGFRYFGKIVRKG
jgi:hypothetical protein